MAEAQIETNSKRAKISRAQQFTMLEVLGASLVLGACVVISMFLIKYINFNTKVITAKDQAIADYDATIRNVGICVDTNHNDKLDKEELERCNPTTTSLDSVSGSLRYKVLTEMAQNTDLESVARQRNESCYEDGERIDFNKLYEESSDDKQKQQYLQMSKICSALRVIPDALPAQQNTEALMASLNQIFILTGWEPDRLAPRDDGGPTEVEGLGAIPVSLSVEGSDKVVLDTLDNIEHSIREFDITTATIEWTSQGLNLDATADAFYLLEMPEVEKDITVKAADGKKAKKKNTGSKE